MSPLRSDCLVRWGPVSQSIDKYRQNCLEFLDFIRKTFPPDITQPMWLTSPLHRSVSAPLPPDIFTISISFSSRLQSILIEIPGIPESLKRSTRFLVMEANTMVAHTPRLPSGLMSRIYILSPKSSFSRGETTQRADRDHHHRPTDRRHTGGVRGCHLSFLSFFAW